MTEATSPETDGPSAVEPWTIVLLAEHALTAHDVRQVGRLHDPQPVRLHLVVAVDTEHNPLVEAIDEAALGHVRAALRDSGSPAAGAAHAVAQQALEASVAALRAEGLEASGDLAPHDPVDAVVGLAGQVGADEILVITEPHLLEESFRRDWASRLRAAVELPVLHIVAGTDRVVG